MPLNPRADRIRKGEVLEDDPETGGDRAVFLTYRPEFPEMLGFMLRRVVRQRWLWLVFAAVVLIPALSDRFWLSLLIGIGVACVAMLMALFFLGLIYQRHLEPSSVHIDNSGVQAATAATQTHLQWSFFTQVHESRLGYEMVGARSAFLILKRAFTAESEEVFRALCDKHCGKRFVSRTRPGMKGVGVQNSDS